MKQREASAALTALLQKQDGAEASFRAVLESAPDAMIITDSRGRILLLNAQTERVFGYPQEELVNQPVEILLPKELRSLHERHRTDYLGSPRTHPMGSGLQLFAVRRNGSRFPVEVSLSPIEIDGETLVISAVRDITDRVRAEEERARLGSEQAARAAAERALAQRDEFLSVAAHELKTPLTSLRLYVQILLRLGSAGTRLDPDRLADALKNIDIQTEKISRLVDQLLDVSRIEAGKLLLHPEDADLVPLVAGLAGAAQNSTTRHSITFSGPLTLPTRLDPLRVEQVVANLLDNAVKFSPDGGAITVSVEDSDDQAVIMVTDRGLGVPKEMRSHIFDRFYQAHSVNSSAGMGLGLYISAQIVELHQGRIWAEFPEEGGTRFVVSLPRRGPDA